MVLFGGRKDRLEKGVTREEENSVQFSPRSGCCIQRSQNNTVCMYTEGHHFVWWRVSATSFDRRGTVGILYEILQDWLLDIHEMGSAAGR